MTRVADGEGRWEKGRGGLSIESDVGSGVGLAGEDDILGFFFGGEGFLGFHGDGAGEELSFAGAADAGATVGLDWDAAAFGGFEEGFVGEGRGGFLGEGEGDGGVFHGGWRVGWRAVSASVGMLAAARMKDSKWIWDSGMPRARSCGRSCWTI